MQNNDENHKTNLIQIQIKEKNNDKWYIKQKDIRFLLLFVIVYVHFCIFFFQKIV